MSIKYWRKYLKDVERRYGKDVEVYIMTEDGEKRMMLQTIRTENSKEVLYLKAVKM